MDDFMKMAMEMVKAQAGVRAMSADDMAVMVMDLAKKLAGLSCGCAGEVAVEAAAPATDGKKSIKENSVVCCECGKKMKLITKKHLELHGLTKAEYLAKHGMKKGTSLMAKGLARARKEKMTEMKLWERRGKKGAKAAAPKKAKAAKAVKTEA